MKGINLNPKQQEAASHLDGPMAVLSVAGSGKTMVLTERIIQLIRNHGVDASSILAITFAKKAVLEIIGRLESKLNGTSKRVHVSTFHSLGYRILKKTGYPTTGFRLVYDDEQLRLFIEAVSKAKVHEEPLDLLKRVSLAKNDLMTPQELNDAKGKLEKATAKVLVEYEMLKRRRRVVDFDDLLCLPYHLLSQDEGLLHHYQDRFRYVLVDEFQDSSKVMVELVKLLSGNHQNIWVAGDDDQTIHGFRGARADTFIAFEKHCNGRLRTVAMNQNYRSSGNIIAMANRLISENKSRVEKEMETNREAGEEVQVVELFDEIKEAAFIAESILDLKKLKFKYSDIAILELAETRAIARALRFAGDGVVYCSAEEISHLESGNGNKNNEPAQGAPERPSGANGGSAGGNGGNGAQSAQTRASGGNGNGNGNGQSGRLTNKQLNYIVNLGKEHRLNSKDLDQEAVSAFGVKMAHLSVKEATEFIEQLIGRDDVQF